MENGSSASMGVFSVAVSSFGNQLRREVSLRVIQLWGEFTEHAVEAVKTELPLPGHVSVAGAGQPGTGLNYATGALRNSVTYDRTNLGGGALLGLKGHNFWRRDIGPTLHYNYYYANGRANSETYHGYDYVEAARKKLEARGAIFR